MPLFRARQYKQIAVGWQNPAIRVLISVFQFFFRVGELKVDFEDVFRSKTRMKILKLLFKLGQLKTSDLARRIGTSHASTLEHLVPLAKEDIIEQRVSGRTRFSDFQVALEIELR
jgi:DNA-binding transcriptional ArsR family regulator